MPEQADVPVSVSKLMPKGALSFTKMNLLTSKVNSLSLKANLLSPKVNLLLS
jgi:hypothetical protein